MRSRVLSFAQEILKKRKEKGRGRKNRKKAKGEEMEEKEGYNHLGKNQE